jgi:hypothetical protein
VDDLAYRLQTLKTETQNKLLVSNSYLHDLQKQLEFLRSKVKEETDEKYHLEDKQKNVSRELSQVALGIKNIFNRCVITMNNTKLSSFGSIPAGSSAANTNNNNKIASAKGGNQNNPAVQTSNISPDMLYHNIVVIEGRMKDLIDIIKEYSQSTSEGNYNSNDLNENSTYSGQSGFNSSAPNTVATSRV